MALDLGWSKGRTIETFWPDDPAFFVGTNGDRKSHIPPAKLEQWKIDGDAGHLRDFIVDGAKPTRMVFRSLDGDERRYVKAVFDNSSGFSEGLDRAYYAAFRIAMAFPDVGLTVPDRAGREPRQLYVSDHGIRMLSKWFVDDLERQYVDLVYFYGEKIYDAAFPRIAEKKALLLQYMQPKSEKPTAPAEVAESTPGAV